LEGKWLKDALGEHAIQIQGIPRGL